MKNLIGKKIKIRKSFYTIGEDISATIIAVRGDIIYAAFKENLVCERLLTINSINRFKIDATTIENISEFYNYAYQHFYLKEEHKFFEFLDENNKCRK
jgi:hypothetical protein